MILRDSSSGTDVGLALRLSILIFVLVITGANRWMSSLERYRNLGTSRLFRYDWISHH